MGNETSRTEEPGTTTKRSEVVPLVQGDIAKARVSVENEGRRGQPVSVDTEDPEAEVRYTNKDETECVLSFLPIACYTL